MLGKLSHHNNYFFTTTLLTKCFVAFAWASELANYEVFLVDMVRKEKIRREIHDDEIIKASQQSRLHFRERKNKQ